MSRRVHRTIAPPVMPIEPSPLENVVATWPWRTTSSRASKKVLSVRLRSSEGFVTSAPSCSRISVMAFPDCFWSCCRASLKRIPLPWIVTFVA